MSRDVKRKRAPGRKTSAGGTLIGLFIGLVLGIVGAAAVVWYVNKMPTPLKEPQQQQPIKPDANNGPAPLPGKPGDPIPEKRFQFYDILPGKTEAKVEPAAPAPAKPAADAANAAAAAAAAGKGKPEPVKEAIYLQAGSFQNAGDADNQKARLAFMGIEAAIQQVMVQDRVWYRVRLGPYTKIDDVNRVRAELAKQGIEAAVAKKD